MISELIAWKERSRVEAMRMAMLLRRMSSESTGATFRHVRVVILVGRECDRGTGFLATLVGIDNIPICTLLHTEGVTVKLLPQSRKRMTNGPVPNQNVCCDASSGAIPSSSTSVSTTPDSLPGVEIDVRTVPRRYRAQSRCQTSLGRSERRVRQVISGRTVGGGPVGGKRRSAPTVVDRPHFSARLSIGEDLNTRECSPDTIPISGFDFWRKSISTSGRRVSRDYEHEGINDNTYK
jgi:hypothetical protein